MLELIYHQIKYIHKAMCFPNYSTSQKGFPEKNYLCKAYQNTMKQ